MEKKKTHSEEMRFWEPRGGSSHRSALTKPTNEWMFILFSPLLCPPYVAQMTRQSVFFLIVSLTKWCSCSHRVKGSLMGHTTHKCEAVSLNFLPQSTSMFCPEIFKQCILIEGNDTKCRGHLIKNKNDHTERFLFGLQWGGKEYGWNKTMPQCWECHSDSK